MMWARRHAPRRALARVTDGSSWRPV